MGHTNLFSKKQKNFLKLDVTCRVILLEYNHQAREGVGA